jgi:hypothetical protein
MVVNSLAFWVIQITLLQSQLRAHASGRSRHASGFSPQNLLSRLRARHNLTWALKEEPLIAPWALILILCFYRVNYIDYYAGGAVGCPKVCP